MWLFVVVQSLSCVWLFATPWPGFTVFHYLPEFAQTHVHWITDVIQPSHPLSPPLLPFLNPSHHQIFSNELALHIRWPKNWSFSFSTSPSKEYSWLISFRIDWLDLLAVQGSLKSSPAPQFKSINSLAFSLLSGPTLQDYWKDNSFDYMDLLFSEPCLFLICCLCLS